MNVDKVSYWSRTVMVPLLALESLKPKAQNPHNINIQELFITPPDRETVWLTNPTGHWMGDVMLVLDQFLRHFEWLFPKTGQQKGIEKAVKFIKQRLNGEDGLGGIFPAMANALMAFHALGFSRTNPDVVIMRKAIDRLLVFKNGSGYCQPCLSPVWDTGLAVHAMLEAGHTPEDPGARLRLAGGAPDSRRQGRLEGQSRPYPSRWLGIPVLERSLPRC
jgi:squalene-hopene/tetraprenyl-beta-curcumene cyclase